MKDLDCRSPVIGSKGNRGLRHFDTPLAFFRIAWIINIGLVDLKCGGKGYPERGGVVTFIRKSIKSGDSVLILRPSPIKPLPIKCISSLRLSLFPFRLSAHRCRLCCCLLTQICRVGTLYGRGIGKPGCPRQQCHYGSVFPW